MNIIEILGNVGFDWRVFLFNLINFTILLFLLRKFFFSKITAVVESRQKIIEEGINNAEKAKVDLENADVTRREILSNAKDESLKIIEESKKEAASIIEKGRSEAQNQAEGLVKKARQDSEKEKEKIMSEVKTNIAKIVTNELKNKLESNVK